MTMREYIGTFIIGDFHSGHYIAASVWQPSSAILCDDRCSQENVYRGPYWLVFNLFQSPNILSFPNDVKESLLSSLSHMAFNKSIPYILCHVERSSIFNNVCRSKALAMATEILSRVSLSQRIIELGNEFDSSPVWLDPRDFSSLLYFAAPCQYLSSQL